MTATTAFLSFGIGFGGGAALSGRNSRPIHFAWAGGSGVGGSDEEGEWGGFAVGNSNSVSPVTILRCPAAARRASIEAFGGVEGDTEEEEEAATAEENRNRLTGTVGNGDLRYLVVDESMLWAEQEAD